MRSQFLKLILFYILLLLLACEQKKSELLWEKSIYQLGSQSSPRTADLTGDGVADIVIGAGLAEMAETQQGVIALDGKTGETLWEHPASASMVGSAVFFDVTGDEVKDVFIGGRNANLLALDGKSGQLIWKYQVSPTNDPVLQYAHFNFYNSCLVPDQNGDHLPELLSINGGNWDIPAHTAEGRQAGVLMLFDLKTGEIIAADTMPDGKESYMSPVCFKQKGTEELQIVFGTGGETIGGNLYLSSLTDFLDGKLNQAKVLAFEDEHGFIAPPLVADLSEDGILDIIAISHASTLFAIDGKTLNPLWKQGFEGFESSNALSIGYFTEDKVPDIFAIVSEGIWPNNTYAMHLMLDGRNGKVLYRHSPGCFSLSSAVVYDLNQDGLDEVIFSNNEYDCTLTFTLEDTVKIPTAHSLIYLNFSDASLNIIDHEKNFKNFYSTPWIGDLDQDGYLDIVYPVYFQGDMISRFMGMKIKRVSTSVNMHKAPIWGSYLGPEGASVFPFSKNTAN